MHEPRKTPQRGAPGAGLFRLTHVSDPKMRIVLMAVALLVLIVAMLGLGSYADEVEKQPVEGAPSREVTSAAITGLPVFDEEIAGRVSDDKPEARRIWPQEAVHYLLLEAANTPAVAAYNRDLWPINGETAQGIRDESHTWRFQYVRFRGPLDYIREEDFEATYGERDPPLGLIHRGRVVVGAGESPARVLFLTPVRPQWVDRNTPEPRPETRIIEDGWVRGRGIFVKRYLEGDVPVFLVVATALERDYATVPVSSLEDVPFSIIDDDPAIGQERNGRAVLAKEYPRALYRLVRYAEERAGEQGAERRKEEELEPEQLTTVKAWEDLVGQPARNRARYLGGLGIIAVSPQAFGPSTIEPNDAGVQAVLNGWIVTDQNKLFQFLAPASLAGDWKERTRVYYEGYFYKTKLYAARNGTDRLAPVLVLTVLNEVPRPKTDITIQVIIACAFVAGLGILIFIVLREDKTKESYRRLRRKRVVETP